MNISEINKQLSWTGIELIPVSTIDDSRPFYIEIRDNHFEATTEAIWSRVQNACTNAGLKREFILFPLKNQDGKVAALCLKPDWLKSWIDSWYELNRYLGFLLFPQEEETRPVDDPMARSYPVIQRDSRLTDGYRDVYDIFHLLWDAQKRLKSHQYVYPYDDFHVLVSRMLEREAFDKMMVYVIKNLPEYTNSQLETTGEELWHDWKRIEELNGKGVM